MAKRKRGRPAKPMPEKISDSPENVAKALLFSPPKDGEEWEYLSKDEIIGAYEDSAKSEKKQTGSQ